ncbi:hypothetical protein Y032_0654g1185 [Ancylostoma ceylanicum]|uniref:Uncharacterized protein n=1 Tax=Ancylostoma ceylanicum TaxID=53326 RepID=A0A016WIL2_9BILA|nr:hypothetical protein Y032_0654g1185 [Ancylostoma ceylanicum]
MSSSTQTFTLETVKAKAKLTRPRRRRLSPQPELHISSDLNRHHHQPTYVNRGNHRGHKNRSRNCKKTAKHSQLWAQIHSLSNPISLSNLLENKLISSRNFLLQKQQQDSNLRVKCSVQIWLKSCN